jgi:uncharacterized protein (TIGR02246 family)
MPARTPEEVDRLFAEHINAGNVDAVVALYEPQATFVPQEGAPITSGDGIRKALSEFAAMKPKLKMNVSKTVTAGNDLALLYNDWTMTVIGPDGKSLDASGKAIEIVRRQPDGSWLFVLDDPFGRR